MCNKISPFKHQSRISDISLPMLSDAFDQSQLPCNPCVLTPLNIMQFSSFCLSHQQDTGTKPDCSEVLYSLTDNTQKRQDFIKRYFIFPLCYSEQAMWSSIKIFCSSGCVVVLIPSVAKCSTFQKHQRLHFEQH